MSTVLCNSEAWFNLSKAELNLLETVDTMLLRRILSTPKTTPKEMLFLELGVLPLREIIKQRRLTFLKYILDQSPDSIIFKVFEKQCENRSKKDWVSTVINDLEELELNVNFGDIQEMNNGKWKSIVKQCIKEKTFSKLNEMKKGHSKVNNVYYSKFELQDYFLPTNQKITKEEARYIFKMRTKMINLKPNYKGKNNSSQCSICNNGDETQEHLYNDCNEIIKGENNKNQETPDYNSIIVGNVTEKLKVARIFMQKMEVHNKLAKTDIT